MSARRRRRDSSHTPSVQRGINRDVPGHLRRDDGERSARIAGDHRRLSGIRCDEDLPLDVHVEFEMADFIVTLPVHGAVRGAEQAVDQVIRENAVAEFVVFFGRAGRALAARGLVEQARQAYRKALELGVPGRATDAVRRELDALGG